MAELTPEQKKQFANLTVTSGVSVAEEQPTLTAAEQNAMNAANKQSAELMVMKAALIEITASRGWQYVEKFAETIVRDLEKAAIEEEDDSKANGKRRDARGALKFKEELLRRIAIAKNQEPSQFLEVVTE